jgi:hypothetical protein
MIGIADVNGAHAGIEVCEEHQSFVVDRRHALVRGMRAKSASAATEVAGLLARHIG